MRSAFKRLGVFLLIIALITSIGYWVFWRVFQDTSWIKTFETNDISDYGNYSGNIDNTSPAEFITSFFPEAIEQSFSDIIYHYKAKAFDTYAYEVYLEFIIEDVNTFSSFLNKNINLSESVPFRYDDTLMEYTISNVLDLNTPAKQSGAYAICYAKIGKILYSIEEQRIIFIALGVYDGGGTDTSELDYFFSRFQIDCYDYQQNAYFSHDDQRNGILYKDRY